MPTIITQILSSRTEIDLGNVKPTRDLTFVNDTCNGFIEILKSQTLIGEVTNIGMNQETSVQELINQISEILNISIIIKQEARRVRPENSEVERLCCDNMKLMNFTTWKPKYDLKKGLEETINRMKNNLL